MTLGMQHSPVGTVAILTILVLKELIMERDPEFAERMSKLQQLVEMALRTYTYSPIEAKKYLTAAQENLTICHTKLSIDNEVAAQQGGVAESG